MKRPQSHLDDPLFQLLIKILNNTYELERKIERTGDPANLMRNIERIKNEMTDGIGLFYEDPMGQAFNETRTDLEATISGTELDNLIVTDVIKPIIRIEVMQPDVKAGAPRFSQVVQKGIVVVETVKDK